MTLQQITDAKEINSLRDYYLLSMETDGSDPVRNRIRRIASVCVQKNQVVRQAVAKIADDEEGAFPEDTIADSLARILIGSTVIAEPNDLLFLSNLFDRYGYDGRIRFLPLRKLAGTLFPGYAGAELSGFADFLNLQVEEEDPLLRQALLSDELLQVCKEKMGGRRRRVRAKPIQETSEYSSAPKKPIISNKTLKKWSRQIWSVSPWQIFLGLVVVLLLFFLLKPKSKNTGPVDRDSAPINYLVISWDEAGKYGNKPCSKEDAIEFRIPYGVYNVLNNNSIPIDLTVHTEEEALLRRKAEKEEAKARAEAEAAEEPEESLTPAELSASVVDAPNVVEVSEEPEPEPHDVPEEETDPVAEDTPSDGEEADSEAEEAVEESPDEAAPELSVFVTDDEEEEDDGVSTVILRPSSSREITVDKDQYITLSEGAKELIFFYVSAVPEEKESSTTGNAGEPAKIVYAYIKGTDVRFRAAPSLEGQVLKVLNNGQQVQVLGVVGEWTAVSVQDTRGYIFSQYLSSEDTSR